MGFNGVCVWMRLIRLRTCANLSPGVDWSATNEPCLFVINVSTLLVGCPSTDSSRPPQTNQVPASSTKDHDPQGIFVDALHCELITLPFNTKKLTSWDSSTINHPKRTPPYLYIEIVAATVCCWSISTVYCHLLWQYLQSNGLMLLHDPRCLATIATFKICPIEFTISLLSGSSLSPNSTPVTLPKLSSVITVSLHPKLRRINHATLILLCVNHPALFLWWCYDWIEKEDLCDIGILSWREEKNLHVLSQ